LVPVVAGPVVLPGVTLVEPESTARPNVDVTIADGRIVRIAAAGGPATEGARVVAALRGHFVAPALADLHVHNPPANIFNLTPLFLLLYLRQGIVRLREAGDVDGTGTPAALALIESGAFPGLDLHYSYSFVTTDHARWPNSIQFDSAGQADAIVAQLRHMGARWVKSYENLDIPRVRALVAAARRAGLGVLGHVPAKLAFEEALLPDTQHYFGVPAPTDLRRDHIVNRIVDWQGVTPARIAEIVEVCRREGLAMTPTHSSGLNILRLEDYETERESRDVRILPDFYRDIVWHPVHGLPIFRNISAEDFHRGRDAAKRKLELTHALWRAGVPLRLGTDVQQPFAVPGFSLHQELASFECAGIPRGQAWQFASRDAARVLGVEDSGAIREGMRADLLTSDASPLEVGWSTQRLSAVLAGGHLMLTADLDTAIERERARFAGAVARLTSRWLALFALARFAKRAVP
jgi:cytosine/adenosine deaminase-related metal-dependent hydrolase